MIVSINHPVLCRCLCDRPAHVELEDGVCRKLGVGLCPLERRLPKHGPRWRHSCRHFGEEEGVRLLRRKATSRHPRLDLWITFPAVVCYLVATAVINARAECRGNFGGDRRDHVKCVVARRIEGCHALWRRAQRSVAGAPRLGVTRRVQLGDDLDPAIARVLRERRKIAEGVLLGRSERPGCRELRVRLGRNWKALIISEMQVQHVELAKRHPIDRLLEHRHWEEVSRHIQHDPAVLESRRVGDDHRRVRHKVHVRSKVEAHELGKSLEPAERAVHSCGVECCKARFDAGAACRDSECVALVHAERELLRAVACHHHTQPVERGSCCCRRTEWRHAVSEDEVVVTLKAPRQHRRRRVRWVEREVEVWSKRCCCVADGHRRRERPHRRVLRRIRPRPAVLGVQERPRRCADAAARWERPDEGGLSVHHLPPSALGIGVAVGLRVVHAVGIAWVRRQLVRHRRRFVVKNRIRARCPPRGRRRRHRP
mmetsp:Transcript_21616/g.56376  ORF Transcript_21616/g.56376 Transcript_21616/m.56376 type:complete len:484 (+) Transcript_21616:507-1958(+)